MAATDDRPTDTRAETRTAPLPYVDHVRADGARIAELVRHGDLDAPAPPCPGWTLAELVHHVGYIHRWARLAALTGARPDDSLIDPPPSASAGSPALAAWFEEGVDALTRELAALDPAAPTWHPFTVARVGAVWPRRQAHETSVHRWDAEAACGAATPMDPRLAADGIAEWFEVIAPRIAKRDDRDLPIGTIGLRCADTGTVVTVTCSDGRTVDVGPADGVEPDVSVEGDAESLLLALWARRPLPVDSSPPLVAEWFRIGGN